MNLAYTHLAIVFLNVICYYRSLRGDFVFDDSVAILKNKNVYMSTTTLQVGFRESSIKTSTRQLTTSPQ
jgi:hypothetical protein